MTIEIRELVIEAQVSEPVVPPSHVEMSHLSEAERERLIVEVMQRVFECLNEERWRR